MVKGHAVQLVRIVGTNCLKGSPLQLLNRVGLIVSPPVCVLLIILSVFHCVSQVHQQAALHLVPDELGVGHMTTSGSSFATFSAVNLE